jgi:hypothetical protein
MMSKRGKKIKQKPILSSSKAQVLATCLFDMSESDPQSQSLAWLPSNLPYFNRKHKRRSKAQV